MIYTTIQTRLSWTKHTCSSAEIKHPMRILERREIQFTAGDHEIDVMGEIHSSLLIFVVGLYIPPGLVVRARNA